MVVCGCCLLGEAIGTGGKGPGFWSEVGDADDGRGALLRHGGGLQHGYYCIHWWPAERGQDFQLVAVGMSAG